MVQALETQGRRCWIAHRDIPPGVPSWAEPIVTAIAGSRLVLVLLSAHSIPSVEVLREVTIAADEKIPLLPVSLDATPLSPGLRYFFAAGQRLDLAQAAPAEQLRRILPAVGKQFPASA
jgi:TIR domain